MKHQIIPSIIAKNQDELNYRLKKVKFSKIIHLDIMDGKFIKNKSLMFNIKLPKGFLLKCPNSTSVNHMKKYMGWNSEHAQKPQQVFHRWFLTLRKRKYEAHLMMKNPIKWINNNYKRVDLIIVHHESENIKKAIELIKKCKRKIGIAINPQTSLKELKIIPIEEIDTLLIMTVYPGKYGSSFLPAALKKVSEARRHYPHINLEVDGGINDKTITKALHAGANKFVIGSYLQNSDKPRRKMRGLKRLLM